MIISSSTPSSTGFGLILFSLIALITARKNFMKHIIHSQSSYLRKRSNSKDTGELITPESLMNEWKLHFSDKIALDKNNECDLFITNELPFPIMLCWISPEGQLQNHYLINDNSIKDGSVVNFHEEYTCTKHSFVCFRIQDKIPNFLNEIENMLFHFTPLRPKSKHCIKLSLGSNNSTNLSSINYLYDCVERDPLDDPFDTAEKEYLTCTLGGFHIFFEPGVFESIPEFFSTLEVDLLQVNKLLPFRACQLLKSSTAFWVNKSITFGTKRNPIDGKTCTFHPLGGKIWLIRNGLSEMKEGCIEIFCAEEYLKSRQCWGTGGVILHELCHAFHNKHCQGGYNCFDIQMIYHIAMKKRLYDCVPVHGKQGLNGPTKAYACTNCMEFFAELSVAYHYNIDIICEYNKWFPFNRAQLIEYDPETFFVLDNIWNQYENNSERK